MKQERAGRELLRVLAMPFHVQSIVLVAVSSFFLMLIAPGGFSIIQFLLGIVLVWLLLLCITNYALRLIDEAANGARTAPGVSPEMIYNPFTDSRCWVHPAIAATLVAVHLLTPGLPVAPTIVLAVLLLPASLGACAISGHARDAVNPASIWRVVRGFSGWYLVLVLFVGALAGLAVLLATRLSPGYLLFFALQMLLLISYAGIGGALYLRRFELDFLPRIAPEREQERAHAARAAARQRFLDGLYGELRVRGEPRAVARARDWFSHAAPEQLPADVEAIIAAAERWSELAERPRLLHDLALLLVERRETGLALRMAEAGLAAAPGRPELVALRERLRSPAANPARTVNTP